MGLRILLLVINNAIPGLISRMYESKINNEEVFKYGNCKPLREFPLVDDESSQQFICNFK